MKYQNDVIRDFCYQIEGIHREQLSSYRGKSLIVYRGQGLMIKETEKLLKIKHGLMSFNNFLSTSKNREVSLLYATTALLKTDTGGILFQITIDPSVSSTPFAFIREISCFQEEEEEEEVLFSRHTVFRLGEIKQIGKNSALYQVDLKLTSDDDEQLRALTNRIREETSD